jgi:hypothetical protein
MLMGSACIGGRCAGIETGAIRYHSRKSILHLHDEGPVYLSEAGNVKHETGMHPKNGGGTSKPIH